MATFDLESVKRCVIKCNIIIAGFYGNVQTPCLLTYRAVTGRWRPKYNAFGQMTRRTDHESASYKENVARWLPASGSSTLLILFYTIHLLFLQKSLKEFNITYIKGYRRPLYHNPIIPPHFDNLNVAR